MLIYILKVSLCWLAFYGLYYFFLRKETFFSVNRIYLLSSLLLGAIIPLMEGLLPAAGNEVITYYIAPINEQIVYVNDSLLESSYFSLINWSTVLLCIYSLGVLITLFAFISSLTKLRKIYKTADVQSFNDYKLVKTSFYHLPFSFFNLIFWSTEYEVDDNNKHRIITHELAHINGAHSMDSILLEVLSIIFWCSPLIYLYKISIKNVHEYLADNSVLKDSSTQQYGRFLLNQRLTGVQLQFANHLINSQLKSRIIMMTKNKSNRKNILKYSLAIPLCLVLFLYCSKGDDIDSSLTSNNELIESRSTSNFIEQKVQVVLKEITSKYSNDSNDKLALRRSYTEEINNQISTYPERSSDIRGLANNLLMDSGIPWAVVTVNSHDKIDVIEISEEMMESMISRRKNNEITKVISSDSSETTMSMGEKPEVYKVVDEMPRFPGCDAGSQEEMKSCAQMKMLEYIYTNIKYPAEARKNDVQGTTVTRFIVRKDGSLSDIKSVRKIGGGCDEESLRVVESMPNWIPGKHQGQAVDVQFNLPIKFKLND